MEPVFIGKLINTIKDGQMKRTGAGVNRIRACCERRRALRCVRAERVKELGHMLDHRSKRNLLFS